MHWSGQAFAPGYAATSFGSSASDWLMPSMSRVSEALASSYFRTSARAFSTSLGGSPLSRNATNQPMAPNTRTPNTSTMINRPIFLTFLSCLPYSRTSRTVSGSTSVAIPARNGSSSHFSTYNTR